MKKRIGILMIGIAFLLFAAGSAGAQQVLLPGATIPKFVEQLPVAGDITVVDATQNIFGPQGPGYTSDINNPFDISAQEFKAQILPAGSLWPAGTLPLTCVGGDSSSWTWGYRTNLDSAVSPRPSYLGPVVVTQKGVPFYPNYLNNLPVNGNVQQNLPIDMTLDWANPQNIDCLKGPLGEWLNPQCGLLSWTGVGGYTGPMPIATHLHGGEVSPEFDGGPDAWFTPSNAQTGIGFPGNVYQYPNDQQESTIWFHDHALGLTRLNVYAGLAGVYPILDLGPTPPLELPPGKEMPAFPAYDIPLIIQDRSFDTNCQIFYNLASNPQPNPTIHPFWIPEFIGDTIVVNGKTWPNLDVEPRQYRFRLVNGSNARFYDLTLNTFTTTTNRGGRVRTVYTPLASPFVAIATDDGYLQTAASTPNVIIGPGERYEVLVDFTALAGQKIIMRNAARTPFPGGGLPTVDGTDTVMQFTVKPTPTGIPTPAIVAGDNLRRTTVPANPIVPILTGFDPVNGIKRQLTLNEVIGAGGPLELVVNNSKFNLAGILPGCTTPLCRETELPAVGDTEIWEIINITADAHPMHTHLTSFQIIDRQAFRAAAWVNQYDALLAANGKFPGGGPPNQYNVKNADGAIGGNPAIGLYLRGAPRLPLAHEAGWKDTVIAYPGEVTRIVIRWGATDVAVPAAGTCLGNPLTDPQGCVGVNTYPNFDPTVLAGPASEVGYVWHCHIVDHEDNEMMRNYVVGTTRQPVLP